MENAYDTQNDFLFYFCNFFLVIGGGGGGFLEKIKIFIEVFSLKLRNLVK